MDYETFGEHQWAETGIFEFMEEMPKQVLKNTDFIFSKPKDLFQKLEAKSEIHVPNPISWADAERDLTAWLGNEMQDEAFAKLYEAEDKVKQCKNAEILNDWNYLQASDHFYYMCTKWFSDGDVHRYFNPYPSPYEAFINYMNALSDFLSRVDDAYSPLNLDDMKEKAKDFTEKSKQKIKDEGKKAKDFAEEKWDDVKDYSLDDIAKMSNAKVKELIKKVDTEELAKVLKNAKDEVKDKIIPNMTKKAKTEYDRIEKEIKSISKEDVKNFTNTIESEIKNLFKKK